MSHQIGRNSTVAIECSILAVEISRAAVLNFSGIKKPPKPGAGG